MNLRLGSVALAAVTLLAATTASQAAEQSPHRADDPVVSAFDNVTRSTAWTKAGEVKVKFDDFHPQSLEVVGNRVFMTSVEIIEPTKKYPAGTLVDGYDRTAGKGRGHLFVMDLQGNLIKDVVLGEGDMYHPGGLDYDGHDVYVPVSQYRPNSSAIIYKVDATTYQPTELFRVQDHIGGVVLDRATGHLVGQSWGSRRFYDWTITGRQTRYWLNENHFLDYQDCEYLEREHALCSGVTGLPAAPGATTGYELGGFAMIDLSDLHPDMGNGVDGGPTPPAFIEHEVPLQLWSPAGHVITRNPTDLDADGNQLTLYTAPDDSNEGAGTSLLIYQATVTPYHG